MEYNAKLKIREEWGDKPCDHPRLEKMYYSGAFLISYACVICGREFTITQKLELNEERKNALTSSK